MQRILQTLALALALALTVPAAAQTPAPPQATTDGPNLARAKKLLDQLAEMLAKLVDDVRAVGDDTEKITEMREAFWKKAEAFHAEGTALQEALTVAEKAALEAYGKQKITPLLGQLMAVQARAEEAQAAKRAVQDTRQLAADLVRSAAAAYSEQQQKVAYGDRWRAQDPAESVVVRLAGAKGKPEEVPLCDLGDEDPQASLEQNLPDLEQRLAEGAYVRLERSPWLGKTEFVGPDQAWKLKWTGRKLLLTSPGKKGSRTLAPELPVDKQMSASPIAVYFSPTQPVIVVQMYWDGGKFYRNGENSATQHHVIWLPAAPLPTKK